MPTKNIRKGVLLVRLVTRKKKDRHPDSFETAMVAITLNTFGEAGGLVSYSLLWCMASLTLTSFTSWKLIRVLRTPAYTPPMFFYFLGWIVIHIGWAISAFLVYWQPDPSAPAQPGRWNVYYLPLVFFLPHPIVVTIFHWWFWTKKSFLVAAVFIVIALGWDIVVFLMFWLVGGSFIAGIVHVVSFLWIFYITVVIIKIRNCNGDNGPSEVNFCSTIAENTTVTTGSVPLTTTGQRTTVIDPLYDASQYSSNSPLLSISSAPPYASAPATVMLSASQIGSEMDETYASGGYQQKLFKAGRLHHLVNEMESLKGSKKK